MQTASRAKLSKQYQGHSYGEAHDPISVIGHRQSFVHKMKVYKYRSFCIGKANTY